MTPTKLKIEPQRAFRLFAIVICILLAAVNYFPVFSGKVPFPKQIVLQFPTWTGVSPSEPSLPVADIGDLVTAFYPFRALAARAIREGTLPLWNPYLLGGSPFLANAQSALFYPPNWLYYILPVPIAWTLCLMLRMFLAAFFMSLLIRSIGGSKAGALFSGITFASCGFMTGWQGQPMADAAIWLPLICYAIHRLHNNPLPLGEGRVRVEGHPSKSAVAFASFAFAMPVLAGHPETAAHVTLTGILMALLLSGARFDVPFLVRFALSGLLAVGLASVQWIPTLEWIGEMKQALEIIWPAMTPDQILGWVSRDVLRSPNSAGIWIPESAAYIGMMTLLAASMSPFHKATRHVVFFAVITFLAFTIAYGIAPMYWLASHTPVIRSLKNWRLILIASFGLAGLGGLGISALEQRKWVRSLNPDPTLSHWERVGVRVEATAPFFLLSIALVTSFLLVYDLQLWTAFKVEFTRRPSFARTLLFLSAVPMFWKLYGGLRGYLFPISVCALAAFDLMTFGYGYTGFAAPKEIFPPAPAFDFLAKNLDPARYRMAQAGTAYPPNSSIMYWAPAADGYEFGVTPSKVLTRDFCEDRLDGIFFSPGGVFELRDRRLDMLNVKYLVISANSADFNQYEWAARYPVVFNNGYIAIVENKSVLPRAYAVPASGIEILSDPDRQMVRLRDASFDPERSVILSEPPPSLNHPDSSSDAVFAGAVEITDSHINHFSLHAKTSRPAVLVVSQTFYPGWKAAVDGNDVPVFPANFALTGLALPAGEHDVRFKFDPVSFKIGLALSFLSALIVGGIIFWRK